MRKDEIQVLRDALNELSGKKDEEMNAEDTKRYEELPDANRRGKSGPRKAQAPPSAR